MSGQTVHGLASDLAQENAKLRTQAEALAEALGKSACPLSSVVRPVGECLDVMGEPWCEACRALSAYRSGK